MKEVEIDIPASQIDYMQFLLLDTIPEIFQSADRSKVQLLKDITTVEFEIVKECEKICQMKERLEQTP